MPAPRRRIDHAALGERITARRVELGMSKEQLAARVGMTRAQVDHHETARRGIGIGNLVRFADALDVTIDWLVGRSAPAVTSAPSSLPGTGADVTGGAGCSSTIADRPCTGLGDPVSDHARTGESSGLTAGSKPGPALPRILRGATGPGPRAHHALAHH